MSVRHASPRLLLPATIAAAALLLSGCSGDPGSESDTDTPLSPLEEYMSALWDTDEGAQDARDAQELRIEELIAECMAAEGFAYEPNTQNRSFSIPEDDDSPEWGSMEFAKEYGYGIVESPWINVTSGQDQEYVDPNEGYVNSLSQSEQTAYYEVLYGPGPTEEEMAAMEEGGSFRPDWTQQGCAGTARYEVEQDSPGGMAASMDPEFSDLFEAMNEVMAELYSDQGSDDPDLARIERAWSDCMADAGYPDLVSPIATQSALSAEYWESTSSEVADGANQEQRDTFKQREIEVAVADVTCGAETGYTEQQREIQFAIEQKFIDENQAALDALVAKHGVGQQE